MLSCFTCLSGWMSKEHMRQVLKLPDDSLIMASLHECLAEYRVVEPGDYPFAPGPKAFGLKMFKARP